MSIYRTQMMQPRNGHTLVALLPARISGCESQKEISLEDQEDHCKEIVGEIFVGDNVEYRVIATKGKGELITRPELAEIEALIRSRELDVIVVEDIGRLVRGTEANRLCGIAVDHGTRVIAVHDCIDTWDEGWEADVIAACRDHVGHNDHTSKRIKKKLMLRFKRKGAATPCPIAGYVKPEDAESFHDWHVDETVRPIILDGGDRLRKHLNCSALADYFNSVEFPVGPYCRNEEWDGAMVRRYYKNPILKGKPERGNMHSDKHHETGKRRSVKNPEGPVSIDLPHLAIFSDDVFDELNALLTEKNSSRGRKPYANGVDPLMGNPRKRTLFPGQHACCWYCGHIMVWGGNGIKDHLQCTGSRQYKCWHSTGIHGGRLAAKAVLSVWELLDRVAGLQEDLFEIAFSHTDRPTANLQVALNRLESAESELAKQEQNLLDTIAAYGPSPMVENGMKTLSDKKRKLQIEKSVLQRQSISGNDLPESKDELRNLVKSKFLELAMNSYEFGQLFPKIVPEVFVYSVRLCTGGPLLPRAKFKVDLSGSFEGQLPEELEQQLVAEYTVDLFDRPQFEIIRDEVVKLNNKGMFKKSIGQTIDGTPTLRMINKALDLQEVMETRQLVDPYLLQLEPPADLQKLKRHLHARYEFKPVDDYYRCDI